jgi:hypothetical protein
MKVRGAFQRNAAARGSGSARAFRGTLVIDGRVPGTVWCAVLRAKLTIMGRPVRRPETTEVGCG